MIKFFTTLFVTFTLIGGIASAQTINQSPQNSLQQQGSSTQNTRNVQSSGSIIPEDNSASALSEAQPESLGVVGNPNQEKPSVSVGRSGSTAASEDKSDTSRWLGGAAVIVLLGVLALLYSRRVRSLVAGQNSVAEMVEDRKESTKSTRKKSVTKEEVVEQSTVESPAKSKSHAKSAPVKKKPVKSSKKKRSKNHR